MRRNSEISLTYMCPSKKEYDSIYPTGSSPGIIYGSAKLHKPIIDNCPSFRPILSATETPTYNLAMFLVPILLSLTVNEFTVHDSFSFAKEVVDFGASKYHGKFRRRKPFH